MEMNSLSDSVDSSSGSRSDSSQSSVNSEAIVAGDNVSTTINREASLQITNDDGEKNNRSKRGRKRKIDSLSMEAVEQHVGKPIGQAAESFRVSRSTLKRICRPHGWLFPKHDERTLGVTDSKLSQKPESKQNLHQSSNGRVDLFGVVLLLLRIKRWSCSSKRHGCSGKWWSCGKHGYPPSTLDSMYQILQSALRGMCSSLAIQWWSSKSIQANVLVISSTSAEAPTSVFVASSEPLATTNVTHDHPTLVHPQQQTNLPDGLAQFETIKERFIETATASEVKKLTIKATYEENMVKFSFTLIDGLVKLKEMVATRFQLRLGSFKLKYKDEDGEMILIACDMDLMLLVDDPKQPIKQPVTRLLVLPIEQPCLALHV